MVAKTLGEQIYSDILNYTSGVKKSAEFIAEDIQKQMVKKAEEASPKREYPSVVRRITVHRSKNVPKAKKEIKADYFQPGYFRKGWTTGSIKTKNGKIYGARNRNMPTVTHLLNFEHNIIAHGEYKGVVPETKFVDNVQEWGEKELDRRLSEFLEKRNK